MTIKAKKTSTSMMKKMLLPMILVMLVQSGLCAGTILWGGAIGQLEDNAFAILGERVLGRKNYLQNEMVQRWSNIQEMGEGVQRAVEGALAESGASPGELGASSPLVNGILAEVAPEMVYTMRRNSATGVFVLFAGQGGEAGESLCPGLYIRDMDPGYNPSDTSDLLAEIAPSAVAKGMGITLDTWWRPQFALSQAPEPQQAFFYKPFQAAAAHPEIGPADLSYWSHPFRLSENDVEVITYSRPLVREGKPYGVVGVELSLDYLRKTLPYDEIAADKQGVYMLGVDSGGSLQFDTVLANGPIYTKLFGQKDRVPFLSQPVYQNVYRAREADAVGCVQYLQLYNTNTPFEDECWALVGIAEEKTLLGVAATVQRSVILAFAVSLLIGIVGLCLVGKRLTAPVSELAGKVRTSDPQRPVKLDFTGIDEIDELALAIEQSSKKVADAASKLSRIMSMVNIPIGAFELYKASGSVFCTGGFFQVLGLTGGGQEETMPAREFWGRMASLMEGVKTPADGESTQVYEYVDDLGAAHWSRLKLFEDEERILGVAVDITKEMAEKRKIEYERDYDLLTNLLNRYAFQRALAQKAREPQTLKTAAFMMMDLDNLKYINDTYGHDCGDEYIRCTAGVLRRYSAYRALAARMSGDEFYIFVYGYDSKEEVRALIGEIRAALKNTTLPLPDNQAFHIRCSAGVAWYPDDSSNLEELIKFADFAMYTVKNTVKGGLCEFDREIYNKDSFLLHSREELNKMVEEELVDYAFQPIVDAHTGQVFAYEALMRPRGATLTSPADVLRIARSQSQLYQIEHLTWFKAMHSFVDMQQLVGEGCKIFINSIANQILSPEDVLNFERLFGPYLGRIVLELTENERIVDEYNEKKQEIARRWGMELALDDFGTGYNGDAILLSVIPQYIKIDMSIIRGIDKDKNRQELLANLASYAKVRKIKVLAEGVETGAELETVIAGGVDYLQGYYLGKPALIPQPLEEGKRQEIGRLGRWWGKALSGV